MFKKSIATLLVTAILAGGSANQAEAEVSGDELAAILFGGALIYAIAKERDDRKESAANAAQDVTPNPKFYSHRHGYFGLHSHRQGHAHRHGTSQNLALPLPDQCKSRLRIDGKKRTVYRQRCLERNGYTITKNGTVRHHRWAGRKAKPILVYR